MNAMLQIVLFDWPHLLTTPSYVIPYTVSPAHTQYLDQWNLQLMQLHEINYYHRKEQVYVFIPCRYSQVCGRIIGYQVGEPQAFVLENVGASQTIDGLYVDGLSLTYGSPR